MTYTYKYPRPSVTIDAVIFKRIESRIEILLIQRKNAPFKDGWALPGGFVDMDETLEQAVARELMEETNLSGIELKQLGAFSAIDRDPRGRTISVVFWGILNNNQKAIAGDDAKSVKWFNIKQLPELAFDHEEVVRKAIQVITNKQ